MIDASPPPGPPLVVAIDASPPAAPPPVMVLSKGEALLPPHPAMRIAMRRGTLAV
jgi:hypothetical protein